MKRRTFLAGTLAVASSVVARAKAALPVVGLLHAGYGSRRRQDLQGMAE